MKTHPDNIKLFCKRAHVNWKSWFSINTKMNPHPPITRKSILDNITYMVMNYNRECKRTDIVNTADVYELVERFINSLQKQP